MKTILLTLGCLAGLGLSPVASAAILAFGSVGGAPDVDGLNRLNFDDLPLGSVGGTTDGPNGSATVTFAGTAAATVENSVVGEYAAPFLSGGNGDGFGPLGVDQADGANQTHYLTTGTGSVTVDFGQPLLYLGLLWGSIDGYNTLTFYDGDDVIGSFTGTDILAGANGDQGVNGTLYVNFISDTVFNKVVATSTTNAFEFDNVAYSEIAPTQHGVPEGGTALVLLGIGILGLAGVRRRLAA